MERSCEGVGGQKSARGSAWQIRWLNRQRGQTTRESREWAEGRLGQKPPKNTRLPTERAAAKTRSPQAISAAIARVRERCGYFAIGLGEAGIH